MRLRSLFILLVTALLWTACGGSDPVGTTVPEPEPAPTPTPTPGPEPGPEVEKEWKTIAYTEATGSLVNPERGFYKATDIFSASSPLSSSSAKSIRTSGMTLAYLGFYLTDFMKGDISKAYLDMVQQSMDNLRKAGIKGIIRFAYKDYHKDKEEMDPEVDIVLRHVEQLKPVLQNNEDVIFVLQAGFVGSWGEWYYTSHFGYQPSSDADYEPRKRLTEALLDAVPASREIQLRTPQFKMRMYGLTLKDTLTAATAHDGSTNSRLAGHNDCFGAAEDDWGTFDNETNDRKFWKADSRYFIMGGETCNVSDYCTCTASLKDMVDYHWTFLNSGYHGDVLSRWKKSGCMDEITDRLGYRLVLEEASYYKDAKAGEDFHIRLKLTNKGFAAPMNPRNAEIVFVAASGTQSRFPLGSDPRTWHAGTHEIETSFTLPLAQGTVYLALEDPLLANNPSYSIALANNNVFDSKTGWNKLFELK